MMVGSVDRFAPEKRHPLKEIKNGYCHYHIINYRYHYRYRYRNRYRYRYR